MAEPKPGPLVPARPDAVAERSYGPGFPFKWVFVSLLVLGGVTGAYVLRERQKAAALRAGILAVHEGQLSEASARYGDFRDRLDAWIVDAAAKPPERFVEPRLKLAGLRAGQGLYLRLPADLAKRKDTIAAGAMQMGPDNITTCLGLAPTSARGLYEKGAFLLPSWVQDVRQSTDVMSLRVKDHMLSRHVQADLPGVLGLLKSDWFMLALEQGPDRRRDPVDLFLWDIRTGKRLLSTRVRARGVLLPARILSKGLAVQAPLPLDRLHGGGATDCSIASQLRELAGFPAAEIKSAAAFELTDAGIVGAPTPVDAGLPDAEVRD